MSSTFSDRISAFKELGIILNDWTNSRFCDDINSAIAEQSIQNAWFIKSFIRYAIGAVASMLNSKDLNLLEENYTKLPYTDFFRNEVIAVISAGNIPLAAFHDFFSVLVSGNRFQGKLSSKDNILLPVIAEILTAIEPYFKDKICFVDKINDFDKVIANGSNNSARYFEFYFKEYPLILRKNKNSLAILSGEEKEDELANLYQDIFLYFGMGCRSVSKLFVPRGYNFAPLISTLNCLGKEISQHHHYLNNLEYHKTVFIMNQIKFIDGGISILQENQALASPIGIINYEFYDKIEEVLSFIELNNAQIQCVLSDMEHIPNVTKLGCAQKPGIMDYADGVDIINWAVSNEREKNANKSQLN